MERPSREITNIQIAKIIAKRGTCARLKVGAVITEDNKIISTGYNGPAKDQPHCSAELCKQEEPCERAIHAEANAILNAGITNDILRSNIRYGQRVIYCTTQPCASCAKKIFMAGIGTVYFMEPYRNNDGLNLLIRGDIKVFKINKNGNTKQIQNLQD